MKKTIAFLLAFVMLFSVSANAAGISEWAREEFTEASAAGIILDNEDADYTVPATRGEFSHIIIMMLAAFFSVSEDSFTESGDSPFSDTDDKYVSAAYRAGIVSGTGNGEFMPVLPIRREEAAKMLVSAYEYASGNKTSFSDDISFGDEISDWAKPYICAAVHLGIMEGTGDGFFGARELYTREQGVITVLRLYNILKADAEENSDFSNPKINAMLKCDNGYITDGEKNIILNGINLGGWLLSEAWMGPTSEKDGTGYAKIISDLTKRFGKDRTNELIYAYENSFISEKDFETIEKLGFNCIRVPFWYRNFTDEWGKLLSANDDENPGFKRFDRILEQCEKHNIYVIFDMHGCPGGQSMNHSTGDPGKNELYENSRNLNLMENIWTRIAGRYKDNIYIAAYDIMNEPQNNSGFSGERAWKAGSNEAVRLTNEVYDKMISAIRKVDKNHIITVEGVWSVSTLPNPESLGWTNMMYQLHIYDSAKIAIDLRVGELTYARKNYGVIPLVGEYNSKKSEAYAAQEYEKYGISRIKWTYKTVGVDYDDWGLFNKDMKKIDISSDSYETIMKAFSEEMVTENGFVLNKSEYDIIKSKR